MVASDRVPDGMGREEGVDLARDYTARKPDIVEQARASSIEGGVLAVEGFHQEDSESGWRYGKLTRARREEAFQRPGMLEVLNSPHGKPSWSERPSKEGAQRLRPNHVRVQRMKEGATQSEKAEEKERRTNRL